jgi:predicted MPP superfamily phosphohydrolase
MRICSVILQAILVSSFLVCLAGCGSGGQAQNAPIQFAVVSDPHLHDKNQLGGGGADFSAYLEQDPKLLAESSEILDTALASLKLSPVDFVLITGDLTKDGERINHQAMIAKLAEVKASGKNVFVIPGNHDINNPQAVSYTSSPPSAVATVSPEEFRQIYADYGYNSALFSDPDSLSYIVEPVPGLWLFALDSCQYDDNLAQATSTIAGSLKNTTLTWILDHLRLARLQGKTVIGMMHHGIIEHLTGQAQFYPEYLLNNWQTVAQQLADNGLQVMFTGHFHANDVTKRDFAGSQLYDIETGSLVSYALSYRTVTFDLSARLLTLNTSRVDSIPSHPADFTSYAYATLLDGFTRLTKNTLSDYPYGLTEPLLSSVTARLVAGLMAHSVGSEAPDLATLGALMTMQGSQDPATQQLGSALAALWNDLPPADSAVSVRLSPD